MEAEIMWSGPEEELSCWFNSCEPLVYCGDKECTLEVVQFFHSYNAKQIIQETHTIATVSKGYFCIEYMLLIGLFFFTFRTGLCS